LFVLSCVNLPSRVNGSLGHNRTCIYVLPLVNPPCFAADTVHKPVRTNIGQLKPHCDFTRCIVLLVGN